MKKSILVVSEYYQRGGLERLLVDLVRGLDPVLFEVTLLVKAPGLTGALRAALPGHVSLLAPTLFAVQSWQERLAQAPGPDLLKSPARLILRLLRDCAFLLNIPVMRSCCRSLRPDVMQIVNGGYPGGMICLAAAVAGRMASVPYVDLYVLSYPNARSIGFSDRRIDRWVADSVHSLTANSEAARLGLTQLRGMPSAKTSTIYSGLPKEPRRGPLPAAAGGWRRRSDEILIGLLSVFMPVKGHRFLIEAAAILAPRFPRVRWILAGDGPTRPRMMALCRSLGLSEMQVAFPGAYPGSSQEVAEALDIVVHPATHESFPYAILEAMRAGKPIIATRIAGIPEQIEDGISGVLVEAGDARALAEAMERLLTDPVRGKELGRAAGRRFRERFTIEAMRQAFRDRYEKGAAR